ncbi:MAG TPA: hypothetical protein VGE74_29705 [Gemmata sp.]
MWIKKSFWVEDNGDLVFGTETTYNTRTVRDASGRTRTETTETTQHFGFLGIEDVKDVETLIHEVLLARRRDDDDDGECPAIGREHEREPPEIRKECAAAPLRFRASIFGSFGRARWPSNTPRGS